MTLLAGKQITATITQLERRRNSTNGNPSWRVHLHDGRGLNTKTDAAVGYALSPSWEGDRVTVVVDGRGQIIDAERVQS